MAEDLKIQSESISIDKNTKFTIFEGDVNATDFRNNVLITEYAEFNKQLQLLESKGKTTIITSEGYKIASLGLRIRKGCSYHGLNFNIDMDMSPWSRINPCGLGVKMTQLADLVEPSPSKQQVIDKLAELLQLALGYNSYQLGSESILAEYKSKEI